MAKFKIIEESRFLNKNALENMKGGTCIGDIHTICVPNLTQGFNINPMCRPFPRGTCDIGWRYEGVGFCVNINTTICGGDRQYDGQIPMPLP